MIKVVIKNHGLISAKSDLIAKALIHQKLRDAGVPIKPTFDLHAAPKFERNGTLTRTQTPDTDELVYIWEELK